VEKDSLMDANKLLYWLSHLGEGSWDSFRKAAEELSVRDGSASGRDAAVQMRFRLSELGDIDFFPEKRRRWQIVPPLLAGFPEREGEAVLCGGRTPASLARLIAAAEAYACSLEQEPRVELPDKIRIRGKPDALAAVAVAAHIKCELDFVADLVRRIVPIQTQLAAALTEDLMIGWQRKYFDLRAQCWVDEPLRRTACECISQYGRRATYVRVSRTRTVRMPKREALYAAASLSGIALVLYDAETRRLSAPMRAPLPDPCGRLACISSGSVGTLNGGRVHYSPVSPRIAEIILAALGQSLK
jgi:hypothetical protein